MEACGGVGLVGVVEVAVAVAGVNVARGVAPRVEVFVALQVE
jgi:hypothetical protein